MGIFMEKRYVTRYSVKEICDILELEVPESCRSFQDEPLTNMAYSLKFVKPGGAFFLRGKRREDRIHLLEKAIEEKVRVVFTLPALADEPLLQQVPHVIVQKPFTAVQKVSASIRDKVGMKVVGVTGSIGKTSTKDVIYNVLNNGGVASRSLGNQNTIFPIFDNMQRLPLNTEYYVQEFGIKTWNVMPNTVNACVPNAAVVTNIQEPHLEVFGTKENIMGEKLRMAKRMAPGSPVFLNYDDELLRTAHEQLEDYKVISFAVDYPEADYRAENIDDKGFRIEFDIVRGDKRTRAVLNSPGRHNIGNALVACAVGEYFGISERDIIAGIAEYGGGGIRQNIVNVGGYTLFLDCYNTAPTSLLGAVAVLDKLEVGEGGRRIAVMSDMPRMGEGEGEIHRETGEKLGQSKLDLAFCFGDDNARILADAIREQGIEAHYTADRDELDQWLRDTVTRADVILFKGSVPRLLPKTVDQVFGTSLHAGSEHFEVNSDGDWRMKVIWESPNPNAKTVAAAEYRGADAEVAVPAQSEGVDVFTVGSRAFYKNEGLKKASIPEPIYNIGASCFNGCSNLESVELPSTLKVIEASAFRRCESLTEIVIPEGVTEIAANAFRGCKNLRRVVIPSTVGRIGDRAFWACKNAQFEVHDNPYAAERVRHKNQADPEVEAAKKGFFFRAKRKLCRMLK